MNVEIAIGEMHRFELCDALLIYRESRRSFITWHTVTTQKQGPPLLGPAQPLTTAFVDALAESLSGGAKAEVLPEKILAKTDRMLAWWTPRRVRRMFFENAEGKAQRLNGKIFSATRSRMEGGARRPEDPGSLRQQATQRKDHARRRPILEPFG